MTRVVFLDRDGVINQDSVEYIKSVDEWKPIPGSLEAIADLSRAGFRIVVITNQSGLARGLYSVETLEAIHAHFREALAELGGEVAGIFYCPHHPDDACRCRKPLPGLLEQAEAALSITSRGAFLVGDKESDLQAGARMGCQLIRVETGYGKSWTSQDATIARALRVSDLAAAVRWMLDDGGDANPSQNDASPNDTDSTDQLAINKRKRLPTRSA